MPIRKHPPVDEKEMHRVGPRNTICQMLRQIYFKTDDPEIKTRCRVAVSMAKSMSRKLTEYKKDWDAEFWDKCVLAKDIRISKKTKVSIGYG